MSKDFKKYLILGFLFFFPIFVYVFLSTGINNFAKLPVLTEKVKDIKNIEGNILETSFKDKISIVAFWGGDINNKKSEALNLNQKIYKRFYEFQDFQFVVMHNKTESEAIESLKNELISGVGTDLEKWNFISTTQSNSSFLRQFFNLNQFYEDIVCLAFKDLRINKDKLFILIDNEIKKINQNAVFKKRLYFWVIENFTSISLANKQKKNLNYLILD